MWATQTARFVGAQAPALPGHPDGAPLRSVGDIADVVADDVAASPRPRVLVGHSLGGAVAIELALRRPSLADGLILIATGARLPVRADLDARGAGDFPAMCHRLVEAAFAEPGSALGRGALGALGALGPAALRADHEACAAFDTRERAGQVSQPALVVAGGDDRLVAGSVSEELAGLLPNAEHRVVAGAGHMLIVEEAGVVNLMVAAYLARLEPALAGGP